MAFKINISYKGKTLKIEIELESLVRAKIGDKIKGESFSPDLEGYELEITGTSDKSGFPGIKGQTGTQLRRILLTREDKGMNDPRKGLRLRKSIRGEEISEKTSQINMKVIKEGTKKFTDILPKKEVKEGEAESKEATGGEAAPTEAKPEEPAEEKPVEAEKPAEEKPAEEKPAEEKTEKKEESKEEVEEKKEEEKPEAEEAQEPTDQKGEEAEPEQEPKTPESQKQELATPEQEPKTPEKEKAELAQPGEEPK